MPQFIEIPITEVKIITDQEIQAIAMHKKPYAKPNLETQSDYTVLVAGAGSF